MLVGGLLSACGLFMPTPLPLVCTAMGCESQVLFELDVDIAPGTSYSVQACVDAQCEDAEIRVPAGGGAIGTVGNIVVSPIDNVIAFRLHGADYSGSHAVTLNLELPDGGTVLVEQDVEFERSQPNGPRCEPVCWTATIRV